MFDTRQYACVRERICAQEELFFSPYAKKSANTVGRAREEKRCDFRTDFQRDRDRIIYSNSFKRLKNKTQVFFAPEGDHYITRLTHRSEEHTSKKFHRTLQACLIRSARCRMNRML